MIFSSIYFVFFFLPIVLALYFIADNKFKNYVLLAASILFYAYGEPKFVFVLLLSIVINYILAVLVARVSKYNKLWLIIAITSNVSLLFVYKYLDFSIKILNSTLGVDIPLKGIVLPLGISFFTFQALSYVIDVYRGTAKVQYNPFKVALYIALFPQLIAGPIVRYNVVAAQIDDRSVTLTDFGYGVKRFICGFSKKVIIANNLAIVADQVFATADFSQTTILYSWLGAICYSLQIFYDFSGYSDMAIGLGRMFGFHFEENFNYPYIAKSITDFWRRWHMSLSQWFRDYVYIPLGGSRKGTVRMIGNLLVVWLLTGIWHGANYTFVLWGLLYFVFLVIEKFVIKPDKRGAVLRIIWMVIALNIVNLQWVIFRSNSVTEAIQYIWSMMGGFNHCIGRSDPMCIKILRENIGFLIMGCLFATPIVPFISAKIDGHKRLARIRDVVVGLEYIVVFLWACSYLILGAHNPFIYFNF